MRRCLACQGVYATQLGNTACPHCHVANISIDGFIAYAPALAKDSDGFKAGYFSELSSLEENNYWFRSRNKLILWALKKYSHPFASFLEIGCGTGFVLAGISKAFPDTSIYGSEIFVDGLSFASQRVPSAQCMQMDAQQIPFINEFDCIGAFDVIEHINEDEQVLRQIHSALKDDGTLLLTVPQHMWLWSAVDEHACHVRRYSVADLHSKLKQAGFNITRSTSFVSFLLPAMIFSRLGRKHSATFNPMHEFNISHFLNKLLEIVLMFEHIFIRLGLSLPIGGSRLVIAKKRVS